MNHYQILGVGRGSSAQEIRQAYRRIALTSHPDKVKAEDRDEATRKFQDIQLAYDVLQDYDRRIAYDFDTFGPSSSNIATPPPPSPVFNNGNGTFQPQRPVWNWPRDMPPTPESPGQESPRHTDRTRHSWAPGANSQARPDSWYANFHATRQDDRTFVTFKEATMMFRPEDRRHIWLCNDEDDPAVYGSSHVTKVLYVSLQEIFMQELVEVTIFRYRYLENRVKVVETRRVRTKLKPFLSPAAATIDLYGEGNEFPPALNGTSLVLGYKQQLSLIPTDESQLFGENYEGQFVPHGDSTYDVDVQHSVYKDDLRIVKRMFSFEVDIPTLAGNVVAARFRKRCKRGTFKTVVRGQGMWLPIPGGRRGDLYVTMTVK